MCYVGRPGPRAPKPSKIFLPAPSDWDDPLHLHVPLAHRFTALPPTSRSSPRPRRLEMAAVSTELCAGSPVVDKADAKAFKWHLMAALHGCREAQFMLACMYTTLRVSGCVSRQTFDGAAAHFHTNPLDDRGHPPSSLRASSPFRQPRQPRQSAGSRIEPNDALAAEWARKAAEQGQPGGQFLLGLLYWTGRGVEMDDAGFAFWAERAAEWEPGHGPAHTMIGAAHHHGWGVPRNERTASEKWGYSALHHTTRSIGDGAPS